LGLCVPFLKLMTQSSVLLPHFFVISYSSEIKPTSFHSFTDIMPCYALLITFINSIPRDPPPLHFIA